MLVISDDLEREDLHAAAERAEGRIGRPVNPVLRTTHAWANPATDPLLDEILRRPTAQVIAPESQVRDGGSPCAPQGLLNEYLASYLVVVLDEPIIAPSAFKNGITAEDILHAYRNPLRVWDLGDGFTMMIGPNRAAIILEVGYVEGDTAMVVIHAMTAREKFLR